MSDEILDTPLEELDPPLSLRARRAALTLRCRTLRDLTGRSAEQLLGIWGIGLTTVKEIRGRLGEHGLALRDSEVRR